MHLVESRVADIAPSNMDRKPLMDLQYSIDTTNQPESRILLVHMNAKLASFPSKLFRVLCIITIATLAQGHRSIYSGGGRGWPSCNPLNSPLFIYQTRQASFNMISMLAASSRHQRTAPAAIIRLTTMKGSTVGFEPALAAAGSAGWSDRSEASSGALSSLRPCRHLPHRSHLS